MVRQEGTSDLGLLRSSLTEWVGSEENLPAVSNLLVIESGCWT